MKDGEQYIYVLLGVIAGWWFTRYWPWLRGFSPGQKPATPAPPAAPPPLGPSLPTRLHALDASYGQFAQDAAHTNELAEHPEFMQAVALLADPAVPLATVLDYTFGVNWRLCCVALSALKQRADGPEVAQQVADRFSQFSLWQMIFALQYLATATKQVLASSTLASIQEWWVTDNRLPPVFATYLAAYDEAASAELVPRIRELPAATQDQIKAFLFKVRDPMAKRIRAEFGGGSESGAAASTDSKFLRKLGRFWDDSDKDKVVIEPEAWTAGLDAAVRELSRKPPRSLLVSGEPLTGKSAFLRLLAKRMQSRGWRVFEAGGADLQAGQIYIGQLEGRIRSALEELAIGRKIIWYVPDLLQLAQSGTHSGQSATMLDQLIGPIAAGQVLIWSEATPKSVTRLVQIRPALRRSLEVLRLESLTLPETITLAEQLAARLAGDKNLKPGANFARTAVDAARHYLGSTSLPGSALAILRLTVQRTEAPKGTVLVGRDVLETLSQLTGLPMAILDADEQLDLAAVTRFFTGRVIGQPEAVQSIVARIAMLKSGLNDPGRPVGVLMFAGPTGTGKTELAKAVAEYLFGSVERMVRLDMSEYQAPETVAKILGGSSLPRDADTLVSRIRKQPFSLLLLDEFEKASPFIWDLFLQVFDDGRLTDSSGDTVDFRHCLIILTTNLGATTHRSSGLGFAPGRAVFSSEQIERAMAQTFRPEFQNRLDKVIVFQPLTRELMRGIMKKELDKIFERRGLKERTWAVEWESSALEFLLEKGFSPEMGARPLKRAIDQYVIAPLAGTIVEKRFPEGDQFVFIRRDGDALNAEFVDPDGDVKEPTATDAAAADGQAPPLTSMIRSPTGSAAEMAALAGLEQAIGDRLAGSDWDAQKQRLAAEMGADGFWSRPERFATLGRLELMDRIEVAGDTAHSLSGRLARSTGGGGRGGRDLVSRLALQLHLVGGGLRDLDEGAPDEAVVLVEPVFDAASDDKRAAEQWRGEIAAMYVGWAKRRHMKFETVALGNGARRPALIVSGFGAYRTLAREVGLHVLDAAETASGAGRKTVRVVLAAAPDDPGLARAERDQAIGGALAKAARSNEVVRRYRKGPAPLVRNADGSWRSGNIEDVLAGDFDLMIGDDD